MTWPLNVDLLYSVFSQNLLLRGILGLRYGNFVTYFPLYTATLYPVSNVPC